MKKPTLILDMDGVVLNWLSQLVPFLKSENLWTEAIQKDLEEQAFFDLDLTFGEGTRERYHRSALISQLSAWDEDVIETVHALSEHFNLVGLTSFSDDPVAQGHRRHNIQTYFPDLFDDIVMLPSMSPKREQLARWANDPNVYFIDDTLKHVHEALEEWGPGRVCWFRGKEEAPEGAVCFHSWKDIQTWLHEHLSLSATPSLPQRFSRM